VQTLLVGLTVAGGFAAILGAVAWLGVRVRRRGIGGGLMGPVDEIYNPGAQRARLDVETYEERIVPMASPDLHPGRERG